VVCRLVGGAEPRDNCAAAFVVHLEGIGRRHCVTYAGVKEDRLCMARDVAFRFERNAFWGPSNAVPDWFS